VHILPKWADAVNPDLEIERFIFLATIAFSCPHQH
jgi:hypothetical protein